MRIVQIGKFYAPVPGGMEAALQHLCEELCRHVDLQVFVANTRPKTVTDVINGVRVTRVARWGQIASAPICPSLPRLLADSRADILHVHEPNPIATFAVLAANPSARVIVSFHSEVVRQRVLRHVYSPLRERLLRRAARIIVAAPQHLDFPTLRPYREKCVVIPFGIDVARFQLDQARRPQVEALRAQWGPRIVLFVGRLVYYKGVEHLIAAMPRIPARLLIIGRGPRERALRRRVRALGLEGRVVFLGEVAQDQLVAYYHACDVLVLPSIHASETFGIVQLEAMASGKPVISTQLPTGVSWVNRHGVTGLLVPPSSADALAEAVNRVLDDEALRRRMGEAARRYVHARFTRQRMARAVLELYEEVLSATTRPEPARP
ncbi:Phosphatidyl-myo-inositol mannosyltransferase [bacterium HR10]|nr:Phosphatidyl-myo-inositol mannosyltransferase [bacterium HR10]